MPGRMQTFIDGEVQQKVYEIHVVTYLLTTFLWLYRINYYCLIIMMIIIIIIIKVVVTKSN